MYQKVKSIKDVVVSILTKFPETRDNDRLLMFRVWAEEDPDLRNQGQLLRRFANAFIRGDFSDPESIRRSRQKAQEQHPELRGISYNIRHHNLEPEMREEIIHLTT